MFLSSIRAQSGARAEGALTESQAPRPSDAYGRAKLAAEEALARIGVPSVTLRPVLVAGSRAERQPRDPAAAREPQAAASFPRASRPGVRSWRVPIFVPRSSMCSTARAHLGETYIVAHPEPIEIAAMLAALREGLGREPGLFALPSSLLRMAMASPGMSEVKDKLLGDLVASPAKLMKTGWEPKLAPRAALASMGAACSGDQ